MPTFKSYFIGFLISVGLTIAAYFAVVKNLNNALVIILVLAILQLLVQLIFFLHLHKGQDRNWNLAALFSAFSIIFILVVGSLWIMGHLNYNMMSDHEILEEEGIQVKNHENHTGLPTDVWPEQINETYDIQGNLYAVAAESNVNYYLERLEGKPIYWHGLLRSQDNGKTWAKFFTVTDPHDPDFNNNKMSYNVVGVFWENSKLYVDISNTYGAGSGEGELLRFSTSDDGKTWQRGKCYYFIPEEYNRTWEGNKTPLRPHNLKLTEGCIY